MKTNTTQWPALDYSSWSDTLDTLHQWVQIVGKIRLRTMPWQNHSWHTTLYISPTGFTTQSIPTQQGAFQIDFDFIRHQLVIRSSFAEDQKMELSPMSVAEFLAELFMLLEGIGLHVEIHGAPNELAEAIPFAKNHNEGFYDKAAVTNFWQAMIKVNSVFTKFRSKFIGKCSSVHLFWGAFDLAVTRFSGRPAPLHPGGMPHMPLDVMQEAYSHEVSSVGFWPGSKDSPMPVFYAYCYPSHPEFGDQKVLPDSAFFSKEMGEFFLTYEAVQQSYNPEETLMSFLESTHTAAAVSGTWNRKELELS